jgi:hypothetical protein
VRVFFERKRKTLDPAPRKRVESLLSKEANRYGGRVVRKSSSSFKIEEKTA